MQHIKLYIPILLFLLSLSCTYEDEPDPPVGLSDKITITCDSISDITTWSVKVYGQLYSSVLSDVRVGISISEDSVFDASENFDNMLANTHKRVFSFAIEGLSNDTTYYIKTWCQKDEVFIYSDEIIELNLIKIEFETDDPVVSSNNRITLSGKIKTNINLKRIGYCYSAHTSFPGISDSIIADTTWNKVSNNFEPYSMVLSGIEPGLYNARAFAETENDYVVFDTEILSFSVD